MLIHYFRQVNKESKKPLLIPMQDAKAISYFIREKQLKQRGPITTYLKEDMKVEAIARYTNRIQPDMVFELVYEEV